MLGDIPSLEKYLPLLKPPCNIGQDWQKEDQFLILDQYLTLVTPNNCGPEDQKTKRNCFHKKAP